MNRSTLAREAVSAAGAVEAAWGVACATARLEGGHAGSIFLLLGGTGLRIEYNRAWKALLAACEGDEVEAKVRFQHYCWK